MYFFSVQIITWIYKERKVRTLRRKEKLYNSEVSITEWNNFWIYTRWWWWWWWW